MADHPYRVVWQAGEIIVHAPSETRAVDVALEYLRVPESQRVTVGLFVEEEEIELQP